MTMSVNILSKIIQMSQRSWELEQDLDKLMDIETDSLITIYLLLFMSEYNNKGEESMPKSF